jgi:hypothetical protein
VYTVAVLSSVCMISVYFSALNIASCSAWLLVHRSFNLYCRLFKWLPALNMAMPAPTPCSDLLPSVNICIKTAASLRSERKVIVSAG